MVFVDFNKQKLCPQCGNILNINHNFCKYCGIDLSSIEPIAKADEVVKQLALTAISDSSAEVRKEAVDTLGNFGDTRALGALTYVLLHDPDPEVRRESANELGNLHHPYSLDALTKALKDQSPIVRKAAIEGLKKIKIKADEENMKKRKPAEIETVKKEDIEEVTTEEVEDQEIEKEEVHEEEEEENQEEEEFNDKINAEDINKEDLLL